MLRRLFDSHARFAREVDAFVDGELPEGPAARFEAHLASCSRCARSVADARLAKAHLAAQSPVSLPRSFVMTPAMVAAPPRPSPATRPALLYASRAVSAAGVAAFILFGTLQLTGVGEDSPASDDAASAVLPENASAKSGVLEIASAATALPEAPSAAEAGVASPPPPGASGASVDPDATATDTVGDARNDSSGGEAGTGPADAPLAQDSGSAGGLETFAFAGDSPADEGDAPWTPAIIASGAVALAAIAATGTLEIRRRRS